MEKSREATDVANIRAAYAEAASEAITTSETTVTKTTPATMKSTGDIEKITSEEVGPWNTSDITITKGQQTTITGTLGEDGATWTWALSGGASAQ